MNDRRQTAAERLGAKFATCSHCGLPFAFNPDEVFSVNCKSAGGDYDDGSGEVFLCCSHRCASWKLTTMRAYKKDGIIWRSGKCGGTLMPDEYESA